MTRPMNILLVEDNSLDAMMIERALHKTAADATVTRACDGVEALEIVRSNSITDPYFIVLDINMPRMNGHEFLQNLRTDTEHSDNIVFMLTTSDSEKDIALAYHGKVTGYFVKPQGRERMNSVMTAFQDFWDNCEPPQHAH